MQINVAAKIKCCVELIVTLFIRLLGTLLEVLLVINRSIVYRSDFVFY